MPDFKRGLKSDKLQRTAGKSASAREEYALELLKYDLTKKMNSEDDQKKAVLAITK